MFRRGHVVRVLEPAKKARHVVARLLDDGRIVAVPLSGSGPRLQASPENVTLDEDQIATFTGPRAAILRRVFERLA
jgi:hypothetical protein